MKEWENSKWVHCWWPMKASHGLFKLDKRNKEIHISSCLLCHCFTYTTVHKHLKKLIIQLQWLHFKPWCYNCFILFQQQCKCSHLKCLVSSFLDVLLKMPIIFLLPHFRNKGQEWDRCNLWANVTSTWNAKGKRLHRNSPVHWFCSRCCQFWTFNSSVKWIISTSETAFEFSFIWPIIFLFSYYILPVLFL